MRFDLIHSDYTDCIKNDGTLFVRGIDDELPSMFSALSSRTFSAGDIGEFRIKCNKPKGDSIGIISNTKVTKETDIYHACVEDTIIYYYHGDGVLYEVGGVMINDQNNVTGWKKNDIITVKVDCVKWTVTFMRNDEMVGGVTKIKENDVYYPLIGTCNDDVEYELIL